MHVCSVCSHKFSTKGSLHRHEQNHARTSSYTCSTCQVSFLRHDLLVRHLQIHQKGKGKNDTNRRRSRTACNSCRQSRTRCSGNTPCRRCSEKGLACSFTSSNAWTSTDHRAITSAAIDINYLADSLNAAEPLSSSDQALTNTMSETQTENRQVSEALTTNHVSPDGTAWPWLHEDTFLQNELNLDWFALDLEPQAPQVEDSLVAHSQHDLEEEPEDNTVLTPRPDELSLSAALLAKAPIDAIVTAASKAIRVDSDREEDKKLFYKETDVYASSVARACDCEASYENDYPLQIFVTLYQDHFWPLWPMCSRWQFEKNTFEPLLYLAMVSIGAMYGGKDASTFGSMLHSQLRDELINPLLDIDLPRRKMLPLGQARSLTQAAALYFGQKRAFSYAHHLGGALVASARKMGLFSYPEYDFDCKTSHDFSWVDGWISRESKKRLAYAILRLEMYTSVLHCTRPLVSAEEMDIDLPCSSHLWSASFSSLETFASAILQEASSQRCSMRYRDLIHIALDCNEELPSIEMLHQELLMNAMQEYVWVACGAKKSLLRQHGEGFDFVCDTKLGGNSLPIVGEHLVIQPTEYMSLDSHLAKSRRSMLRLQELVRTVIAALGKVHSVSVRFKSQWLNSSQMSLAERSSLLSCLLVFHLSFLQLNAPLDKIHKVCQVRKRGKDDKDVVCLIAWARNASASVSIQHALSIYHLLKSETERSKENRADVNFLTLIGLYHSAVSVWVYNAISRFHTSREQASQRLLFNSNHAQETTFDLPSMDDFAEVFHKINPAWAIRSSFSVAIKRLGKESYQFLEGGIN